MNAPSKPRSLVFLVVVLQPLLWEGIRAVQADEPFVRPIKQSGLLGPVVGGEDPTLFYYDLRGQKVLLASTGFAAAKPKDPITQDELKVAPITRTMPECVQCLTRTLRSSGSRVIEIQSDRKVRINDKVFNIDEPAPADNPTDFVLDILRPIPPEKPTQGAEVANAGAPPRPAATFAVTPYISVRFEAATTDADIKDLIASVGLKVASKPRSPKTFVLSLPDGERPTTEKILTKARQLFEKGNPTGGTKRVVYSHPDFIVPIERQAEPRMPALPRAKLATPEDPLMTNQWYLDSMNVSAAWARTTGSSTVRVAVVDDAVEISHEDLAANIALDTSGAPVGRYYKADQLTPTANPSPIDQDDKHGTACAGIIAAAHNDKGVRGISPGCKLIGVGVLRARGSQVADAFDFCNDPDGNPATDDGASVISCSWRWNPILPDVQDKIRELAQQGRGGKGMIFVFAAANDYSAIADINPLVAAFPDELVAVGAVDNTGRHSVYSNYGPELSVVAPSSYSFSSESFKIATTDRMGDEGFVAGNYTPTNVAGFGGTSAATPMVAGGFALMISKNPKLTRSQLRAIIEHTSDPIVGAEPKANYDASTRQSPYYGYGRVNLGEAVRIAEETLTNPLVLWPGKVTSLKSERTPQANGLVKVRLTWTLPTDDVGGVLVVRSDSSAQWKPEDKFPSTSYPAGYINGSARVVQNKTATEFEEVISPSELPAIYTVFVFNKSTQSLYSWGVSMSTF